MWNLRITLRWKWLQGSHTWKWVTSLPRQRKICPQLSEAGETYREDTHSPFDAKPCLNSIRWTNPADWKQCIVATECCLFSRKIIWHRSSRKEIVWSPLISSKQQNHQWGTYQHFFPNSLLIGTGRRFFKSTVEDGHFLCAPLRAGISNTPGTEGPCDCL